VQTSLALFDRIFEYLDLPVDVAEREGARDLRDVRGEVASRTSGFAYETTAPVLDGVDLVVPPGRRRRSSGETGSGKTTLAYLAARLYDPHRGRVTIDGVDVRDLSFASLARPSGSSPGDLPLPRERAREPALRRPDATDEEIEAAARAARIHDLIASLPDGYDTVVGERGYRFSGGEKQRIAIARTILRNPPVLVLDEATSALDTATERAVQAALDELAEGRTTIAIAHRLSTVREADQIIVVANGRVAERGTHDELVARGGRYAALLNRRADAAAGDGSVVTTATASPSARTGALG
jgi:ATP-binding cassette subfamily B protein